MTEQSRRYGLTEAAVERPHYAHVRRHFYWSDTHSACGTELVTETTDTTIPVCGNCRRRLARLQREHDRRRIRRG